MRLARFVLIAVMATLSACVTPTATTTPSGPAAPHLGNAALDLGDWRQASANDVIQRFSASVSARYPVGLVLGDASADLRSNGFGCSPGSGANAPVAVCRKSETASDCTYTWQVHVFGENGQLTRTRSLYDRRCGNEGLLGGPG